MDIGIIDPPLPTRSGRCQRKQAVPREITWSISTTKGWTKMWKTPTFHFDVTHFILHALFTYHDISLLLLIPSTASAFGINPPFQVTKQVPSPMASSSTADVLDEAPQQVEDYIHKLQSLGRHMQLQKFRTWLNKQCGLPIEIRPSNINTKEYMQQDQIEQWINEWSKKNAKGTEQRVLRNFLLMDFAVQPNPKMQPCSSCEQQFMLFMLLPMKQHNMNTYDPDDHQLLHRGWADAPSRPPHSPRPTGLWATESSEPESTWHDHGRMRTSSPLRRSWLSTTHLVARHTTKRRHPTRLCHHPSPLGCREPTVGQTTTHQSRWRHRRLPVFSTWMATIGSPGMADQESTLPTGTPDSSLHHVQEPPRRHHRSPTEPHQAEGQPGTLGPPGVSRHQCWHRLMDLGATTTPTISEGLHRMGEGQLHPHGHWP